MVKPGRMCKATPRLVVLFSSYPGVHSSPAKRMTSFGEERSQTALDRWGRLGTLGTAGDGWGPLGTAGDAGDDGDRWGRRRPTLRLNQYGDLCNGSCATSQSVKGFRVGDE